MKRLSILFFFVYLAISELWAVPAHPKSVRVKQPDGTFVTLRLIGDEYHHFHMTTDGYTVLGTDSGYVYGMLDKEGRPHATSLLAHDADMRSEAEHKLLKSFLPNRYPVPTAASKKLREQENSRRKANNRVLGLGGYYDYHKFRGLVLLVEFNDRSFSREDYQELVNRMVNEPNFSGFYRTDNQWDAFTGSVRDYFYDNSNGKFEPTFDVVGPIKIDESQYIVRTDASNEEVNNAYLRVSNKALDASENLVNYKNYDGNNDGVVDMVFFVFAGAGSHIPGNDGRLIWPHAGLIAEATNQGYIYRKSKDNIYYGRYACSTEMFESQESGLLEGIGTICHEFSHVLGLPDMYDTDYKGSGGESNHLYNWSLMAAGSYNNNGRTPVGYSLYDRCYAGFAEPEVISSEGSYSLPRLDQNNKGFMLASGHPKEYFFLENRQTSQSKWDAALPGHGMLVYRIDETKPSVWAENTINTDPSHNYYELLRAGNGKSGSLPSDPFPGTSKKTALTNLTTPSLLSWSKREAPLVIEDIAEKNGLITFNVVKPVIDRTNLEDFEDWAVTTPSATEATTVKGRMGLWTLSDGAYIASAQGKAAEKKALAMTKNSNAIVSTSKPVKSLSFMVYNATETRVMPYFYVSEDSINWTQIRVTNAEMGSGLTSGDAGQMVIEPNHSKPSFIRFYLRVGDASKPAYLDNFGFTFDEDYDPATSVDGIRQAAAPASSRSFNLMGQQVKTSQKGLIIRGGKKYLVR